jgi:hypothetical protein
MEIGKTFFDYLSHDEHECSELKATAFLFCFNEGKGHTCEYLKSGKKNILEHFEFHKFESKDSNFNKNFPSYKERTKNNMKQCKHYTNY